jgi:ribosomal protein S18 acetylase RimI-like enzyme
MAVPVNLTVSMHEQAVPRAQTYCALTVLALQWNARIQWFDVTAIVKFCWLHNTMTPANQQEVDRYWAVEMATGLDVTPNAGEVICTAQRLYSGVQLFQRNRLLIIAAPPHLVDFIATEIRDLPIRNIFSVEFVERLLISRTEKILGPAHVSYADKSTFRSASLTSCRLLTAADAALFQSFTAALIPAELEQSGFDAEETPAFGAFAAGFLCAVAGYRIWEPRIAHITVATHPDFRRRGHGQVAVSALAEDAFSRNLILQYRALASNENSLKLGRSLGFQPYCSTIYARLLTS